MTKKDLERRIKDLELEVIKLDMDVLWYRDLVLRLTEDSCIVGDVVRVSEVPEPMHRSSGDTLVHGSARRGDGVSEVSGVTEGRGSVALEDVIGDMELRDEFIEWLLKDVTKGQRKKGLKK